MEVLTVAVDGKVAGSLNVGPNTTLLSLLDKSVKYLPKNSLNQYVAVLNITPTGPHVPASIFSDPRYENTTIETLYHQMSSPILAFSKINYFIENPPNFEVTYKLTPQVPIPPAVTDKVYHYTIDDLYRGHSFLYFNPEDSEYKHEPDNSIKMTSLLYRNDETLGLYKEPPSLILDVAEYITETGIKIKWNAALVTKNLFID